MGQDRLERPNDDVTNESPLRVNLQDRSVHDHLRNIDCLQFIRSWCQEETAPVGRGSHHPSDQEALPQLETFHPHRSQRQHFRRHRLSPPRYQVPNRLIYIFIHNLTYFDKFLIIMSFFTLIIEICSKKQGPKDTQTVSQKSSTRLSSSLRNSHPAGTDEW